MPIIVGVVEAVGAVGHPELQMVQIALVAQSSHGSINNSRILTALQVTNINF